MMVSVGIYICGSNISQFLNIVENSINWGVNIKSHLFDQIVLLGKHLSYNFSMGIKEMLEDDVDCFLGGGSIVIAQSIDVLSVDSCDDFLSCVSLNRKDLFEGPNQFFVFFFIVVTMNCILLAVITKIPWCRGKMKSVR